YEHAVNGSVDDDIFRAGLTRRGGKVMPNHPRAREADKDAAGCDAAAVCHNGVDGDRAGQGQPGKQFIGMDGFHAVPSSWVVSSEAADAASDEAASDVEPDEASSPVS